TFKINTTDNTIIDYVELYAEYNPSGVWTGGNITNMTHDTGDIYSVTEPPQYFNISENGDYYIVARVVDIAGNINISKKNITVDDIAPWVIVANSSFFPSFPETNQNITIRAQVKDNNKVISAIVNITYLENTSITFEQSMYNITPLESVVMFEYNFTPQLEGDYNTYEINVKGYDGFEWALFFEYIGNFTAIGTTRGQLSLSNNTIGVYNITQNESKSFSISINLSNFGNEINDSVGTMYNPKIFDNSLAITGIESNISTSVYLDNITAKNTSSVFSNITASKDSKLGNNILGIYGDWQNPDASYDSKYMPLTLNIFSNPYLLLLQDNLTNYGMAYNIAETIGNICLYSYGNDNLTNITFIISDGNISASWVNYTPLYINSIVGGDMQNMSVVINASQKGYFESNITINATGSICNRDDKCYKKIPLYIEVYEYT
ncbi:MAG: hypothetical protein KAQ92_03660, partial [Candidatus Aenigmarchaeota archaeon]|nr:hypothetical protein [Candidatus Aenigmarchaeota archaeon]